MNANAASGSCPHCGSPIPDNAPGGLCPKCVLRGAAAETEAGQPLTQPEVPSIESVRAAFPQFEVLELIGQGGMGFVYKVRQPNLDRFAALKLLWPKLGADPAFAERFTREARVLARLNHPNIVSVYDFGRSGSFFYLLMEYVDGVNLRQAMRSGHFSPAEALALVPHICDALQFAHEEKVLHRDIKPENILLDTRGRLKIADFGIAKLVGEAPDKPTLTATGMAVGTPLYMAPEQLEHPQDVDQRADIYSLGVVFYEMLTGELPVGRFAPPSEKVTVDPRVDPVVLRALEREREKRFGNAGEVRTRVEDIRSTPPAAGPHGTAATSGPAGAGAASAVSPPPAAPAALEWSRKAILAAVIVGAGMVAPVVLTVVLSYWLFGKGHSGPLLSGGLVPLLMGGTLVLGPAAVGSLLGFLALRDIRRAAGRLRGQVLAICAALYWPLLLFDVVAISAVVFGMAKVAWGANSARGIVLVLLAVSLIAAAGLDLWVARFVWRWASPVAAGSKPRLPRLAVLGELTLIGVPLVVLSLVAWVPILLRSTSYVFPPEPIPNQTSLVVPDSDTKADFVLPAGQVAVFEMVTRAEGRTVPVPELSAYVMAASNGEVRGTFHCGRFPGAPALTPGKQAWSMEITRAGGDSQRWAPLEVSEPNPGYLGSLSAWVTLQPEDQYLRWISMGDDAFPAFGLRIRTGSYPTQPGQLVNAIGYGTNWPRALQTEPVK